MGSDEGNVSRERTCETGSNIEDPSAKAALQKRPVCDEHYSRVEAIGFAGHESPPCSVALDQCSQVELTYNAADPRGRAFLPE